MRYKNNYSIVLLGTAIAVADIQPNSELPEDTVWPIPQKVSCIDTVVVTLSSNAFLMAGPDGGS